MIPSVVRFHDLKLFRTLLGRIFDYSQLGDREKLLCHEGR
jgi:hypothetical protein